MYITCRTYTTCDIFVMLESTVFCLTHGIKKKADTHGQDFICRERTCLGESAVQGIMQFFMFSWNKMETINPMIHGGKINIFTMLSMRRNNTYIGEKEIR